MNAENAVNVHLDSVESLRGFQGILFWGLFKKIMGNVVEESEFVQEDFCEFSKQFL